MNENQVKEASTLYKRARDHGVPAALVVILIAGAWGAASLHNRIQVVENLKLPDVRKKLEKLERDVEKLKEGNTPYQRGIRGLLERIEENIRELPLRRRRRAEPEVYPP